MFPFYSKHDTKKMELRVTEARTLKLSKETT